MATTAMRSAPRMRASLACQSCRKRKVKCDAQTTPTGMKCTPCQQMNIACAVDRNGDRRKSGSRKHIETLENRIQTLEGLLLQTLRRNRQSQGSWDEEMDLRSEGASPVEELLTAPSQLATKPTQSSLANGQKENETRPGSRSSAAEYSLPHFQGATPTIDFGIADTLLALDEDSFHATVNNDLRESNPQAPQDGTTETSPRAESCACSGNGTTTQSSGALGPTSQFHVRLSGTQPQPSCTMPDELVDFGIAVDINSAQVRSRLLHSFFRYQTLWVNVVDEHLFQEHRKGGKPSMWYSNFLETVLLACAARLSTSSAVRSLGERYSSQAKAEVLHGLETPSEASMQGFMLLSEYEVSYGRDRIGWMFCGMACRSLTDLGLHESLDSLDQTVSPHIRSAWLHLLGACIAFEGVWCMYLGRPSSIPRSILQRAASSCQNCQGPETATLSAWLGLCVPMADICDILNSCPSLHAEANARLLQLDVDLQRWYKELPSGFAYDETNTADLDPTAYGVHMQYCKVQILMRQAFCGEGIAAIDDLSRFEQPISCNPDDREAAEQLIYDAALHIVRLLLTYRQIHGAEKIPSVMLDNVNLALTTLINHYLRHTDLIETQKRDIQWLRLAIESMKAIQPHFPIIGRMMSSLQVTVEGTPLAPLLRMCEPFHSPKGAFIPSERLLGPVDLGLQGNGGILGHQSSFNPTSHVKGAEQSRPSAFPSDINTTEVTRILSKEPALSRQWSNNDPEELSASLLCWPNPQIDAFLAHKPISLSDRPSL